MELGLEELQGYEQQRRVVVVVNNTGLKGYRLGGKKQTKPKGKRKKGVGSKGEMRVIYWDAWVHTDTKTL